MENKKVSLSVFITALCAVLVLSVLCTSLVTLNLKTVGVGETPAGNVTVAPTESADENKMTESLATFAEIFKAYSIYDIDEQTQIDAVLKAYATATGDLYAAYYTPEEYTELTADNEGEMEGIGVSVVNSTTTVNGFSYAVLQIISVFENSPALEAGLRVGDQIYSVVNGEGETVTVSEVGYDAAISCVRGVAGTEAKLAVIRSKTGGDFEILEFAITRAAFTTQSVTGRVYEKDSSIGIVRLSQFDLTTPTQFKSIMNELIAAGCDKFVFDVRYNPGGDLASIEAVLATFLQKGDTMITTVYKNGTSETDTVETVNKSGSYATCNITNADIGCYRGYTCAVLINGSTASAAELFTSNLRDYGLATLVGTTTYGKGCMQSIFPLTYFGMEGAVKLTTALYLPPCGESYHEIGISPEEGNVVELDTAVLEKYGNFYLIPDEEDNQLMHAIGILQGK